MKGCVPLRHGGAPQLKTATRARASTVPSCHSSLPPLFLSQRTCATHLPIPSLFFLFPPSTLSPHCFSFHPSTLSPPPFAGPPPPPPPPLVILRTKARHRACGCRPDLRRSPERAIVSCLCRGLRPIYWGRPLGFFEWPPRRVGGPHCAISVVTPPVGAYQSAADRPNGRSSCRGATC